MKVPAELLSRLAVRAALVAAVAGPGPLHAVQATTQTNVQVPRLVRVPQLVDRRLEAGRQALRYLGLEVGREEATRSGAAPGTILWQSIPRDSLVPLKTVIHLRFATPGTSDGPTDRRPAADSDRETKPSATSTIAGIAGVAAAALILSQLGSDSTAAPVAVPDLRDSTIDRARELLEGVGLRLGGIDSTKRANGTGLILSHRPAAGTAVKRGTGVRVSVEVGPPARVPNLIGLTLPDAVRRIEAATLRVGVVDSVPADSDLGRVASQSPAPDSAVWQNTRVGFRIAVQGRWTTVPPLTGNTLDAAGRVLAEQGLALGTVVSVSQAGGRGLITHQSPLPGTRVNRGDSVGVRIADALVAGTTQESVPPPTPPPPPPTLIVPDVRDSTTVVARPVLEGAGFDSLQDPIPSPHPWPWAWIIGLGAAVGAGATALLRGRTRPEPEPPEPKGQPQVTLQPHTQVEWQPAERAADPIDGPELRFLPGAREGDVQFQGEP